MNLADDRISRGGLQLVTPIKTRGWCGERIRDTGMRLLIPSPRFLRHGSPSDHPSS